VFFQEAMVDEVISRI